VPHRYFFLPLALEPPFDLLSTQADGGRENSIALFLIVKVIFIGLTKMPFMILPRF
jgi:hypothetical protein